MSSDALAAPPLASLSLTHVYYNPDDPLSLLSAWLALLPQALMVVYVSTLFVTRELEGALMFAGQLACEALNWVLKRLIKEHRPQQMHGKGYGMPSSHAQFASFFALYLTLLLLCRNLGCLPLARRLLYSFAAVAASVAIATSRIYLNYHTRRQVAVGYSAGLVCALLWFAVTAWLRQTRLGEGWRLTGGRRLWDWGLWIGQAFWVRDRCCEVDLVVEGWRRAAKVE